MKKNSKILLAVSSIILLAGACNQTRPQVNNQQPAVQMPRPASTTAPEANKPANQKQQAEDPILITVYQTVEGSNLNETSYSAAEGQWAMALLKSTHKVEVKSYGSMGEFVTSIDGNAADSKHFWEFFVNGKSSNVGASSYQLKSGDVVEWKLSAINSSKE